MGGTAFLVYGQLSEAAVQAASHSGLFVKLLGKQTMRVTSLGKGRELLSLPPDKLKGLKDSFLTYLHNILPNPWPATVQELEYLNMASKIYVRGEREQGKTDWYVQYSLSGCAGLAEISAEVGYHWLCKWYAAEANIIGKQFFAPLGFIPTQTDEDLTERLFLPIAGSGYAAFDGIGKAAEAQQPRENHFEVDVAVEETLGDETGPAMNQLEEVCGVYRRKGACCCQLCQPNLDLDFTTRLSYFNGGS